MRKPNVLLITIDQLRADCLNNPDDSFVKTPFLDSLADEGVKFVNHFAQAAPCGPSRASLLTGTYLHTHQSVFNGTPLDSKFTNIALEFRSDGYNPLLFGYTDTTIDPRTTTKDDPRLLTYEGHLPGFEVALPLADDREAWYQWLASRGHDISDRKKFLRGDKKIATPSNRGSSWAPSPYSADETETAFMVDKVIEKLGNLPEPWFLHVSILRPHPPFVVPAPYNDLYDPTQVPKPIKLENREHPFIETLLDLEFTSAPSEEVEKLQLRATYYGMVTEVDKQVGRLISALDDFDFYDDTAVVVTSDHGELLGDHDLVSKFGFHDKAFHIPMIIRYPSLGGPKGLVVDNFTENIDVMPTLLDLAEINIHKQCEGASVRPFLEGKTPYAWRRSAHWEFDFRIFASKIGLPLKDCNLSVLRNHEGKLVHFAGMPDIYFDLIKDSDEQFPFFSHSAMKTYLNSLNDWLPEIKESPLINFLATPDGMITLKDPE